MYYVLLQLIFSPINIMIALIVVLGRELRYKGEWFGMKIYSDIPEELTKFGVSENSSDGVTKKPDHAKARNWFLKSIDRYAEWAEGVEGISQDIPLNRFILYTLSYVIFSGIIILIIVNPSLNHIPSGESELSKWKTAHGWLTAYAISFLVFGDLNYLIMFKKKAFSRFWRVYDILFHCLLTLAITCNWILYSMERKNNCSSEHEPSLPIKNATMFDGSGAPQNDFTLERACKKEEILNQIQSVTFALGK